MQDGEHTIFAPRPPSGASGSLEAIFAGFLAVSQRLELKTSASIEKMQKKHTFML